MGKVAAGFVIFRVLQGLEIEYLLLKASYGSKHWTPPKGHVDPGEEEFETALRECQEEAGLGEKDMVIYKNHSQTLNYLVNNKDKRVVYWLAKLIDPLKEIKLSDEHTEFKFLHFEEAKKYADYKDFQDMITKFDDVIKREGLCNK